MSRSSIRRFALAALMVLLVAPWSAAAERRTHSGPAGLKQPRVASALEYLRGLWEKAGCIVDPNGSPRCDPAPLVPNSSTDAGCIIDPNGCAGEM
jgi:hypothetical protein